MDSAFADTDNEGLSLRSGFLRASSVFPDRSALVVSDVTYTYAQLRARAASIAATLDGHCRSERVSLTAVLGNRSEVVFSGVLGALFRGHGYVPLNATFPVGRIRTMLLKSGSRALVVDRDGVRCLGEILEAIEESLVVLLPDVEEDIGELTARCPNHSFLRKEDMLPPEMWAAGQVDSGDTAYLLFTSGSTGEPKGVPVSHENIRHFVDVMVDRYEITETDRFSQMFELTFDLSVFDTFVAWEQGACVCCPSKMQMVAPAAYIQDSGITIWFSVPSVGILMQKLRMLSPGLYPDLRVSLFCGEALPGDIPDAWSRAAPNSIVENLYGPTEVTLACTLYRWDGDASPAECENGVCPIGDPYPGMTALVADGSLSAIDDDSPGELLMAGPQVVSGYWEDAARTEAAFVRRKGSDKVYYRTGDLVRRRRDGGPLVYLGRIDSQVQIRGHRVELQEVETALREATAAGQAVAVGWPLDAGRADGVVGFIDRPIDDSSVLMVKLADRLPDYMVPKAVYSVGEFPLNSNGKVDRQALAKSIEAQERGTDA